jgi:hypothetical protein
MKMPRNRANIAIALVLILLGAWFLALQLAPGLDEWFSRAFSWPFYVIGAGALLALIGLLTWVPEMLVPACIVAGIGGLLYWQNRYDAWESWAYAWALIPGFAGVGTILAGLLKGRRGMIVGGGWTIFNSLVLFAIFGSFLGGITILRQFWPVLLIVLGLAILVQGMFRRR